MTREEAINKLNWALDNNTIEDVQSAYDYIIAIKMAIKALEQEPILDKIRAEIEEYRDGMLWSGESLIKWEAINYILEQIFDKYKEEIEPQESE